ncbi:Hypothetical predicted protein, partial [Paramuricea clavata]
MKLYLYFLVLFVGFTTGFIPKILYNLASWSSVNHRIITRAGLWCSVLEFLKTNPKYVSPKRANELASVDREILLEGQVSGRLFRLVKSSNFKRAVKEIEYANADVDSIFKEKTKAAAHFDAEQFRESSSRLLRLKKQVISLIKDADVNEADCTKARKESGRLLHTLQDFYSHSNWIELGNNQPLSILGDKIIGVKDIAGPKEKTCKRCTPWTLWSRVDDCQDNLLTRKLTSGYHGGQDVKKPAGIGKCSHGGVLDKSRKSDSTGGINKDSSSRYLSPHYG